MAPTLPKYLIHPQRPRLAAKKALTNHLSLKTSVKSVKRKRIQSRQRQMLTLPSIPSTTDILL